MKKPREGHIGGWALYFYQDPQHWRDLEEQMTLPLA